MAVRSFYGREDELRKLRLLLRTKKADLVVVKGRRRIGKSRLVREFAKQAAGEGYRCVTFTGLVPGSHSSGDEREDFAQQLATEFRIPPPRADDWNTLLWTLADRVKVGRHVVVLDEINWLGGKDPTFLGKLKNTWDRYLSSTPELLVILCGSLSGWIESNLLRNTGFLGRISLDMTLHELPLHDCDRFWGKRRTRITAFEKLQLLSVTGGVPRYLEEIDPSRSAGENLRRLCFEREGLLFREFDNLFADLFSRRQSPYKEIVSAAAGESLELAELYRRMGTNKSGTVSEYIGDLEKNGFLSRDFTWSIQTGKESKFSRIRLRDNYLRFYLRAIMPNRRKIERGGLRSLPDLDGILGLQFENLVLNNRKAIWSRLDLNADQIVYDNPFYQRSNKKVRGCQVDYMIQSSTNTLYVCEIKFKKAPLDAGIIKEVQTRIDRIKRPAHFNVRPVLVHVNGVTDGVAGSDFFDEIIDFGSLLSPA